MHSFRGEILCVCLDPLNPRLRFTSYVFVPFFFFFTRFGVTWLLFMYCSLNSNRKCWLFCSKQCISVLFMDPQISLFSNFFIKNGSHGTIHTFKNYFATVFSVFSFQFQQNKFYPNRSYVHNIFTTFSKQIVSDRLLLIVMSEQKSNLSCFNYNQ